MFPTIKDKNKHAKIINLLSRIAADIDSPASNNARLAACVVFRNDIVAFGVNELKTHPLQAKYGTHKEAIYLHAEISAIKNSLRHISVDDLERSTLYVARVKFENNKKTHQVFGLAKPCPGCENCIQSFSFRRVFHTTETGYTEFTIGGR